MTREEFEHVLHAAADVAGDELVVVGSQAILGTVPDAPEPLLRSREVDVFPRHRPERADEIDGALGDGSPFHALYGYYAHGVGPETIVAPSGWESRLVRVELAPIRPSKPPAVAWCLSLPDLVLAKLAAARPHDLVFVEDALRAALADVDDLRRGVDLMPDPARPLVRERLEGLLAKIARS